MGNHWRDLWRGLGEGVMTTLEWPWLRQGTQGMPLEEGYRLREEGWLRRQGSHTGQVGIPGRGNSQCQVICCNVSSCIFIIFQCQDLEKLKLWLWDSVQTLYSLSGRWIYSFVCLFNRHVEGKQHSRHDARSPERQSGEHDLGPVLHEIQQIHHVLEPSIWRRACQTMHVLIFSSTA